MAGCRLGFTGLHGRRFNQDSGLARAGSSCSLGFHRGFEALKRAGCRRAYIDGSFVTVKSEPGDYDACWEIEGVNVEALDPVFLDFSNRRAAQKLKYSGEFFPAQMPEGASGKVFLEFFQTDKETGRSKGIVGVDLQEATL
jgi:hypothetical protein